MSSLAEDEARRGSVFREDGSSFAQPSITDAAGPTSDMRNAVGAIGNDGTASKAGDVPAEGSASAAPEDPLAGMSEADKWGIKGLLALMGKYPTYSALVHGMDTRDFHLDLDSQEQVFVLWRIWSLPAN